MAMKLAFSEYQKRFYLLIGLMVALFAVGLCGYLIINNYISKELKVITESKSEIATRAKLLQYLKTLESDYSQVKDEFSKLYQYLPTSGELINFIPTLKKLAQDNHLDSGISLTVENPATAEEPKSYSFTLYLSGRASDLENYFKQLSQLRYFIRFDQVEINYLEGEGANANYRFNILGRIYSR